MNKKNVLLTALAIAGFAVTTSAQTVPNYVPSSGLLGWWPFNGNAIDESVNTNNGTVNGATLTTDRFGNANSAYSFDGVDDKISIPNSAIFNFNSYSISLWVKKIGQGTTGKSHWSIISKNTTGDGYLDPFHVTHTSLTAPLPFIQNKLLIRQGGGTISNYIDQYPGTTLIDNNYYNIIVVFNHAIDTLKTYVNGNLSSSSFVPYNNVYNTDSINIGVWVAYLNFFKGIIDDIGIWNRALTPSEITGLYNANLCFQTITVTDTLLINTNLTGFNPITYQNTIKIWPNPTNDHITIDNGNLANLTGHQIKISNALGQQVFQSAITQQQFYVDMSTWGGNGIYFVNLINAQGVTIETRKIVLQ